MSDETANAPSDPVDWIYAGNRLHPTQNSAEMLTTFAAAFRQPAGLVPKPFCGLDSGLTTARDTDCNFVGIDLAAVFPFIVESAHLTPSLVDKREVVDLQQFPYPLVEMPLGLGCGVADKEQCVNFTHEYSGHEI